jgi:hypothetical protein
MHGSIAILAAQGNTVLSQEMDFRRARPRGIITSIKQAVLHSQATKQTDVVVLFFSSIFQRTNNVVLSQHFSITISIS